MRHLENSYRRRVRPLLTGREWWWNQAVEEQGVVLTQMLIVADIDRSVRFYRDVLGATAVRDTAPAMLRFHNGWIVINTGGGPTGVRPPTARPRRRAPSSLA